MEENELYVYHLVTKKKMSLGQIISFDDNQKTPYIISFLRKNDLMPKVKTLSRFYMVIILMKA